MTQSIILPPHDERPKCRNEWCDGRRMVAHSRSKRMGNIRYDQFCKRCFKAGYRVHKQLPIVPLPAHGRRNANPTRNQSKTFRRKLAAVLGSEACVLCGWNEALTDVHRVMPGQAGGLYVLDNCVFLCPNHHRIVTHNVQVPDWSRFAHLSLEAQMF